MQAPSVMKQIRDIPTLIVRVEDRRLGILAHSRRAHLVMTSPGGLFARVRLDLVCPASQASRPP